LAESHTTHKKIYELFVYLLLLLAQKKEEEKGTPTAPALRAPLCFSLLPGRWKLTAFSGSDRPASLFVNICDAQRDRMGKKNKKQ
jgi:hypothetical protein